MTNIVIYIYKHIKGCLETVLRLSPFSHRIQTRNDREGCGDTDRINAARVAVGADTHDGSFADDAVAKNIVTTGN